MDDASHTSVSAKVRKHESDPLFTITDSSKTFGTIASHDSAYSTSNGYKISVDAAADNGHVLKMDLVV